MTGTYESPKQRTFYKVGACRYHPWSRLPSGEFGHWNTWLDAHNGNTESTKFIMAHIRNVHRNPTLSSRALTTSGKMNPINSKILELSKVTWDQYRKLPPMPEPAKIIPAARPRRCENHSGSSKITGIKSNPSPIPNSTPCSSMSCHTWPVRISNAMT